MYRDFVRQFSKNVRDKDTHKLSKETWYRCLYCDKEYSKEEKARECLDSHELILLPIGKKDLNRLHQFLYLKNEKLLTESLINIVKKYVKGSSI